MASVAIWSAIIYFIVYILFVPKHFQEAEPSILVIQGLFHGVLVVIIATLTYVARLSVWVPLKRGVL